MNRLKLICKMQEQHNISKKEASRIVRIFFKMMEDTLSKGERVEIRGLFSFYLKEYGSYVGKNPKTGNEFFIKEKKLPFFKCGKELKNRVDYP